MSDEQQPLSRKETLKVFVQLMVMTFLVCLVIRLPKFIVFQGKYVTEQQFNQIHKGMTRTEVLEILGPPHDWVGDDPENDWYYWCDFPTWFSEPFCIEFDENGRMSGISG